MTARRWAAAVLAASAAGQATAQDGPTLGLVMPFSGWFAPIDADTIAGAKLAVQDINARGGVLGQPIEVVEFDTKSDPPLGADGAIDVIAKGADAIIVPSDFDFGAPGAFVAQGQGVPAFSGASDRKFGAQAIGDRAFSISNSAESQGAILASWAQEEAGWQTAYILTDTTISFTQSLCDAFGETWRTVAGEGGVLGEDVFQNGDPSIAAQISRITALEEEPDVIFLCSYAPGGPSAIRQLRAAGIDSAILTGESMDGDYWMGTTPDLSDFYVVNYGSKYGDDPSEAVNDFYRRFEETYGRPADVSYGLRGYAMVEAWARAVEKAGVLDADAVVAALESFEDEPLVIGPTTFSPELRIQHTRPMTILKAEDGTFSAIGSRSSDFVPEPET